MLNVPVSPLDSWTAARLGSDSLSRDLIERWQLERLRETIRWARSRSPLYRAMYRDLPDVALGTLSDLALMPFLEQATLRDHGIELVCVPLGDVARIVTLPTSGSTGPAKRVWFTEQDLELTRDHFRHGMRALVRRGDRLLVLMPGRTPGSVGALLKEGLERDGVEVESYGFVDECEPVARGIVDWRADCLVGVPWQIVRLARSSAGRSIGRGRIRSVLVSGDHLVPSMRAAIEAAWGCRVFEHYGSTEIGLGGAVQCEALAGLHVREADLLFEVVDPDGQEPLADGGTGELVVTTLTRRGMPLIRYRTGDLVRMSPAPCPCRSELRCLESVIGRSTGSVVLSHGDLLGVRALNDIIYSDDAVVAFTANVDSGPRGDRLTVAVEARQDHPPDLSDRLAVILASLPPLSSGAVEIVVEVSKAQLPFSLSGKQRIEDSRRGMNR
jgi:phenylacetate-coenzyme A ligase PaaK-like adenylate-forming protein